MSIKRITAIVPQDMLESLEHSLRKCGVPGVTVEHVQGYGEHPNFFRQDLMQENVRLVLYCEDDLVDQIVNSTTDCARNCRVEVGILAVESIDRLVRLSDDPAIGASPVGT